MTPQAEQLIKDWMLEVHPARKKGAYILTCDGVHLVMSSGTSVWMSEKSAKTALTQTLGHSIRPKTDVNGNLYTSLELSFGYIKLAGILSANTREVPVPYGTTHLQLSKWLLANGIIKIEKVA